jgi:hypothetical protein
VLFAVEYVEGAWRLIPPIFVPQHVSNRYGMSDLGSLHRLLDEAIQAFVFGAPGASIAMCRVCLETVLKEHYGLETTYRTKKGDVRERGLGELIVLASKKWDMIRANDAEIKQIKSRGYEIVHRYTTTRSITAEEERTIVRFFCTLKSLIERAPH